MKWEIILFSLVLFLAILIQSTILTLPLATVLVLLWVYKYKTENLPLILIIFGTLLALIANTPIFTVVLVASLVIWLFLFALAYLPNKNYLTLILIIVSALSFDIMVTFFSSLMGKIT